MQQSCASPRVYFGGWHSKLVLYLQQADVSFACYSAANSVCEGILCACAVNLGCCHCHPSLSWCFLNIEGAVAVFRLCPVTIYDEAECDTTCQPRVTVWSQLHDT